MAHARFEPDDGGYIGTGRITLPCGCRMWTDVIDEENVFMFEPHAEDCEYYLYTLAESERQGKPITRLDLS